MVKGGVWCKNIIDGNAQLEKIIRRYGDVGIFPCENKGYRKSINGNSVLFENGDFWQVLKASESRRGYKLNISYIQHGISQEIIDIIIVHATVAYPFQAFNYYWGEGE
jgi:hypothetical protein